MSETVNGANVVDEIPQPTPDDIAEAIRKQANGETPEPPPTFVTPEWVLEQFKISAWLIAELQHRNLRLATTVAQMLAERMQPKVTQAVLSQILS